MPEVGAVIVFFVCSNVSTDYSECPQTSEVRCATAR